MFGNKWTDEEVDFLIKKYPINGPFWCGERLNRTSYAIQQKAKKIGVKWDRVKPKYQKGNVEKAVNRSKTLSDVLSYLGLRNAGGNYKVIKKYIEKYNIDTGHFDSEGERVKKTHNYIKNNIKKPLNDILVENSSYNRKDLKKRLVEENVIEYKCIKCGNKGEWNGEKLTLHLDHINGVYNDNRVENLRFLCPNCHSQTKTYAGKSNSKRDSSKFVKNGELTNDQKESCKKRRKIGRPSYEQLMEDINNLNYVGTGKKYGVSDNAIRKWKKWYEKHE